MRWFAAGLSASMLGGGTQALTVLDLGASLPGAASYAFLLGNLIESACWRRVASALVIPGGSIPRRRDSRRATAFCARVRPAVPAAPDSPLVRRARLRPQMA